MIAGLLITLALLVAQLAFTAHRRRTARLPLPGYGRGLPNTGLPCRHTWLPVEEAITGDVVAAICSTCLTQGSAMQGRHTAARLAGPPPGRAGVSTAKPPALHPPDCPGTHIYSLAGNLTACLPNE